MTRNTKNDIEHRELAESTDSVKLAGRAGSSKQSGPSDEGGGEDLRRRLLLRVGIAVILIVCLLGGLALLDEMNAPVKKPAEIAEAPTQPAHQAAETATGTGTDTPAIEVPPLTEAKPAEEVQGPEESSTAAAQETSAPPTQAASKGENPEVFAPAIRPLTKPASPRLATLRPSDAASTLRPQPLRSESATELARQASPSHAPASRPLTQATARSAVGGYLLQLGVFGSTAHAEELRAKLELNGISAQIESRVQVGPFASREEADQMRDKLKKLGMEGGVLVATKK